MHKILATFLLGLGLALIGSAHAVAATPDPQGMEQGSTASTQAKARAKRTKASKGAKKAKSPKHSKSALQKANDAVQETGARTQDGVTRGLKRANQSAERGVAAASRGVDKVKKKLHLPDGPPPAPREP